MAVYEACGNDYDKAFSVTQAESDASDLMQWWENGPCYISLESPKKRRHALR